MRMLVFLICLLKPLVHGDVFESEQPVPNRIPISLPARATGTHGLPSGITSSQAPTLGGVAERYGASTSAHRSVMASDLRAGGHGAGPHQGTSHLGSVSEHQASHASGVSGGGLNPGIKEKSWVRDPSSIQDQMALEAAKRGEGDIVMANLTDPNFLGMDKMRLKCKSDLGKDSVVHYVRDPKIGELMDFKFKKRSTD
jgi:hypothetical protein